MDRKKSLTIAGAITGVFATAAIAGAANVGLLTAEVDTAAGSLNTENAVDLLPAPASDSPVLRAAEELRPKEKPEVIVIDTYVTDPPSSSSGVPGSSSPAEPITPPPASGSASTLPAGTPGIDIAGTTLPAPVDDSDDRYDDDSEWDDEDESEDERETEDHDEDEDEDEEESEDDDEDFEDDEHHEGDDDDD